MKLGVPYLLLTLTFVTNKCIMTAPASATTPLSAKVQTKLISWQEFEKRFLHRENGYKYEWLNGEVVKFKAIDYTQFFIIRNLRNLFENLRASGKISGMLILEGDIFFGANHRRPDVSYLTDEQIDRTAFGENQVPKFVIEVVSSNDQMNAVTDKLGNYRAAGVQVVWLILPNHQQVQVFSGEKLNRMVVCTDDDVCSAAPVLPLFEMTAKEVFWKPIQAEIAVAGE
jgi:Uma2 family endonuclease